MSHIIFRDIVHEILVRYASASGSTAYPGATYFKAWMGLWFGLKSVMGQACTSIIAS